MKPANQGLHFFHPNDESEVHVVQTKCALLGRVLYFHFLNKTASYPDSSYRMSTYDKRMRALESEKSDQSRDCM